MFSSSLPCAKLFLSNHVGPHLQPRDLGHLLPALPLLSHDLDVPQGALPAGQVSAASMFCKPFEKLEDNKMHLGINLARSFQVDFQSKTRLMRRSKTQTAQPINRCSSEDYLD
jgi:hypothetical protein